MRVPRYVNTSELGVFENTATEVPQNEWRVVQHSLKKTHQCVLQIVEKCVGFMGKPSRSSPIKDLQ
jgi:hypothetical protein